MHMHVILDNLHLECLVHFLWSKSTNFITQSPLSTRSLMKLCLICICLVLECMIGFLVKLIALVSSHLKGIWSIKIPKSSSCCFIQNIWAQQLSTSIYLTSAMDKATQTCFLECQETKALPNKWNVPLVLFLSTLRLA